jgi:hypothetical protein
LSSHASFATVLVVLAIAGPVAADAADDADLRTFRPSADRRATIATEGIETPGPWNFHGTIWFSAESATLFAREPGDGERRRVVGPRLIAEPTFLLGLGTRAAVGLSLPLVPWQQGAESSSLRGGAATPSQGLGDLALTGKAAIVLPDPDVGGLGVAFLARLQLPTGDRRSFVSESKPIADARLLASYDLGHLLILSGTVGYRARFANHPYGGVTIGDTVPWGTTISLRPRGIGLDDAGRWTWNLEAHGEVGVVPNRLFASSRVSPVFAGGSVRYALGKDFSIFAGLEGGLGDGIGTPRLRGILALTWAPVVVDDDHDGVPDDRDECPGIPEDGKGAHPRDGCPDFEDSAGPMLADVPEPEAAAPPPLERIDSDGDGIPDDVDKCPDVPESKNGYEDDDGCPELDRDGDSFLDPVDRCPDEAETFDGVDDDDGCPEKNPKPALVTLQPAKGAAAARLVLRRPIAFSGASPSAESQADLRAIAAWLLANPGHRVGVAVRPAGAGEVAVSEADARAVAMVEAIVRYAHTGGVAQVRPWDPTLATMGVSGASGNVVLLVMAPEPAPPAK